MSVSVTRTDWAMAQQIVVGGSVSVPSGAHEVVTVISGGPASTSKVTSVTGPATQSLNLEHFAFRTSSIIDANASVIVRTSGGAIVSNYIDRGTVSAQPAIGSALVGVHASPHVYDNPTVMNLMPNMGVVGIGIAWYTAQPSSATWDSSQLALYDAVFADLATRGVKAMVTCGTTPAWARSGGTILSPPTDPANHGNFVASIVNRWGNNILCVDPWNEPNLSSFWTGTTTQYVQLLAADRAAVDPAMPVCLGPFSLNDYIYLDGLFNVGLTGSMFDWVGLHPYPYSFAINPSGAYYDPLAMTPTAALDGSVIGGIHKIESVLASHGVTGKHLMASEVGVSLNPIDSDQQVRIDNPHVGTILTTMLDQLRRIPHMEAIAIHESKDTSTGTGINYSYGLLDQNNNRRSSWAVLDAAV